MENGIIFPYYNMLQHALERAKCEVRTFQSQINTIKINVRITKQAPGKRLCCVRENEVNCQEVYRDSS